MTNKMIKKKIIIIKISNLNCFRNVGGGALSLAGDPWLHPSGLLNALPGFLAGPQAGYASYLTSPRRLPSPPAVAVAGNILTGKIRHLFFFFSLFSCLRVLYFHSSLCSCFRFLWLWQPESLSPSSSENVKSQII